EGALPPLPGEVDLNFIVHTADGPSVLKVHRAETNFQQVDLQVRALAHLADKNVPVPRVCPTLDNKPIGQLEAPSGKIHLAWRTTFLPGRLYAEVRPHSLHLVRDLGTTIGRLHRELSSFEHLELDRELKWDIRRALWIRPHLTAITKTSDRLRLDRILNTFETECTGPLATLPTAVIHNDVNDHNILVDETDPLSLRIGGIIDFGDMIRAPSVCDLAIAGAYAVLGQNRPFDALSALVEGYHREQRLTESELALFYPLLLTRLAVSVTNAAMMKQKQPDDAYVTVTEGPAWSFLRRHAQAHPDWITAQLRCAAGLDVAPHAAAVRTAIQNLRGRTQPMIDVDLDSASVLDVSTDGPLSPQDPFHFSGEMGAPGLAIGRYLEPRLVYTAPEFAVSLDSDRPHHPIDDRRTVHLGVDIFAPAGTKIRTPIAATVRAVDYRGRSGDYGGVVVLEHITEHGPFFTLYGHLTRSVASLEVGTKLSAGECFAALGDETENGGWPPHIHFQVGLRGLAPDFDWPGVADPDELTVAQALFPNPAALLNLPDDQVGTPLRPLEIQRQQRRRYFSKNLTTSYDRPLQLTRGWKHYLIDNLGRRYLDAYNNVPHVGHAHPRITEVAARQMRMLNTNTRYLHRLRTDYAEALSARLPEPLEVCFFLNSASEANELALRLARVHTGAREAIVVDAGYHGHTLSTIDISAYKFNGPGGEGAPDWVHVVPAADPYRGPFSGSDDDIGARYADTVAEVVRSLEARQIKPAAFICEAFPSVGGQIVPPAGYLRDAYAHVREAGGLCIADEVQTGLGRLGRYFWGFEQQDALPDIVVLGKPLGNGYPLSAVVTTKDVAASFANGMEFFSTFGGNTVACAVGQEVLSIIDDEALAQNAEHTGHYLLDGLRALMSRHEVIGDARGLGLFIGVDLVNDRQSRTPATDAARYVVER
ncbi:MAG: aminotransferase class III-fold pyridoxal phosphate-dependent enzyme, partial [Myxococcota bacterium]